jgi:hypothetical protein
VNLGDAMNMKQGLKELKLVDLFFTVMAQPPGILLTSPHPQQLELELHGPESPLVGSSLLALIGLPPLLHLLHVERPDSRKHSPRRGHLIPLQGPRCQHHQLRQRLQKRSQQTTVLPFRMFTTCQPGVGERTSLLHGITDVKVPAGMAEVLNAIRIWRRSAGRSEEVNVTVDPLALAGVLAKFADSVAKLGGSQVVFRLATMRQQLDVDRAPKLDAVKDWAEYIQAELEELSKAQSVAKLAQPHSSASNQMPPVVGPSVKALVSQWEGKEGKAQCKFWGTEQGCRRGERCTFAHEWGSLEKHSRCFACSSTAHRKKDCPTLKSQSEGSKEEKDKKISKLKDSS